jgi:hypothetical protein
VIRIFAGFKWHHLADWLNIQAAIVISGGFFEHPARGYGQLRAIQN